MAGGRGERFWPMSQPSFPKQFLSVFNNTPLIVQTMNRIKTSFSKDERLMVIPEELKRLTYKYIGKERIIIEPMRRNTAPAICLAALTLQRDFGNGVMHVMPADHLISPKKDFVAALKFGEKLAEKGNLVTYGINPDRPETGYGYVKIGRRTDTYNKITAYKGERFTEKPSLTKAKNYLRSKKYLWNSGIFSFSIEDIIAEIKTFMPEIYNNVTSFLKTGRKSLFERTPDISIDYGIMEKSKRLCIVKANFTWDDVGSWLALGRYFKEDKNGNILIGDIKGLEIYDSIMYTCQDMPLRAYGIKELVVVVSPNGILVCKKDKAADLKKLFR